MKRRYATLTLLIAGILAVFVVRAALAANFRALLTFHLFDTLTVAGALFVLRQEHRALRRSDWIGG